MIKNSSDFDKFVVTYASLSFSCEPSIPDVPKTDSPSMLDCLLGEPIFLLENTLAIFYVRVSMNFCCFLVICGSAKLNLLLICSKPLVKFCSLCCYFMSSSNLICKFSSKFCSDSYFL